MMKPDSPRGSRFIFLCQSERQSIYFPLFKALPHIIDFVDTPEDLLRQCVEDPPLAALVDMATSMRVGINDMAPIYDLGMAWPVLRCTVTADGSALAMCSAPLKREPLVNSLMAIAQDDASWKHPRYRRRHIRVNMQCRIRIRHPNEEKWYLGNSLNMSSSGSFIITYEPPALGEALEVEILDITEQPMLCLAETVWIRKWNDSTQLPGIGIRFDRDTVSEALKQAIADYKLSEYPRVSQQE